MRMKSIRKQIHNNAVALISLAVALGSLGYNTWRNETTEEQRNVRHAAFRVLENLGELQQVVDYRHYYLPAASDAALEAASRLDGFGNAAMINDLMGLMPGPAPGAGKRLNALWIEQFFSLGEQDGRGAFTHASSRAEQELTDAIRDARMAVLEVLNMLE